jgi:hypothetical protein
MPTGNTISQPGACHSMPARDISWTQFSSRKLPYLKKPRMPRLTRIEMVNSKRRRARRSSRNIFLATNQSTIVEIQSRTTNGGFQAA